MAIGGNSGTLTRPFGATPFDGAQDRSPKGRDAELPVAHSQDPPALEVAHVEVAVGEGGDGHWVP